MLVAGTRGASASLLLAGLFFVGCDRNDDQIKVYRLVKSSADSSPSEANAIASTNAPVKSTIERVPAAANVTTPSNWEPQPLSQMRQASFLVHGENGTLADISLVNLGAAAGNVLDNVNRWLGQLGEPAITADKLANMIQKLHTPRGDVDIIDITGQPENGDASKDGRIVAAIAPDEGKTSFYKMRGNPDLVGIEKTNFLKWISAIRGDAGSDQTIVQSGAPTSDKPQIKWESPAGWSPAPGSAVRYASFTSADDTGGKIDISIVTFPGDGGNDLDNVNRWRKQIGLAPTDESALSTVVIPLKTPAENFSSIDIAGTNSRMLAAWTRHDGRAWFVKLTGSAAAVEKEKPNFVKFIQSIRF